MEDEQGKYLFQFNEDGQTYGRFSAAPKNDRALIENVKTGNGLLLPYYNVVHVDGTLALEVDREYTLAAHQKLKQQFTLLPLEATYQYHQIMLELADQWKAQYQNQDAVVEEKKLIFQKIIQPLGVNYIVSENVAGALSDHVKLVRDYLKAPAAIRDMTTACKSVIPIRGSTKNTTGTRSERRAESDECFQQAMNVFMLEKMMGFTAAKVFQEHPEGVYLTHVAEYGEIEEISFGLVKMLFEEFYVNNFGMEFYFLDVNQERRRGAAHKETLKLSKFMGGNKAVQKLTLGLTMGAFKPRVFDSYEDFESELMTALMKDKPKPSAVSSRKPLSDELLGFIKYTQKKLDFVTSIKSQRLD